MKITDVMLKKYADVLIRFALNSGHGLKRGEVVYCTVPDIAKPMYGALQASILEAGGIPMMHLLATGFQKQYFTLATKDQLTFFPQKYLKARVDLVDHYVGILADHDLTELKNVDPQKIFTAAEATKKVRDWQNDKEYAGKMTWTIALYGTPAMASAASLTLTEYWDQIIKACFLDLPDPIKRWQEVAAEQQRVIKILNSLPIEKLHLQADHIDLWISLGKHRQWVGGSGRNIPSFEIFTSPDWRGTSGHIAFNQPLYRYGNLVKGVELEFQNGRVIKASATKGNQLLQAMLKRPNADKIGEFSLTDARLSRITKFMANTLFDENIGQDYGNTHIAVGMSYRDAYDLDPRELTKTKMKLLGFNDSGEHTDIISTENRVVTALLTNGEERIIYADGKFLV
jgi:aminopeptidase